MRLIMTDNSKLWNIDDPFWERFKDIILVVCLDGEAVTDKYECFVSPHNKKRSMKYGIGGSKLDALASVAGKLNNKLRPKRIKVSLLRYLRQKLHLKKHQLKHKVKRK